MGTMRSRDLARHVREKLKIDANGRSRPGSPMPGIVRLTFKGQPPTATHQAKEIASRNGHLTLRNRAELKAAHSYYLAQLPTCPQPLAGPAWLRVCFSFEDASVDRLTLMDVKPDLDNCEKVLLDCLEERGYLENDSRIAVKESLKFKVPASPPGARGSNAGVRVELRTITDMLEVVPLFRWTAERDVAAVKVALAAEKANKARARKAGKHGPH